MIQQRSLFAAVTGQVLMLRVPSWSGKTLNGLPVTLTDEHLTFVVVIATGDLLVLLITAVVIVLGVRVVKDGPALGVLHSIVVALVMHLAAPVQIIHRRARASLSTVTAVVSIVKNRPAIRHQTQHHPPKLSECLDIQRLGWSTTSRHNQNHIYTVLKNTSIHNHLVCRLTVFVQLYSPTESPTAKRKRVWRVFILLIKR